MFIEGGCRWGFDRIWEFPDDSSETPFAKHKNSLRLWHKQSAARKLHAQPVTDFEEPPVSAEPILPGYKLEYGIPVNPTDVVLPAELLALLKVR